MARIVIGHTNYSDDGVLYEPVLSGGSWESALPLSNLQTRFFEEVARSTDAAVTSTVFDADLLTTRAVRLLSLWKHNLTSAGLVRARGFSALPAVLDVLDFSAGWTAVGTPTRSAAAFTSDDGVPLDLLGDNDGAVVEGYDRTSAPAFTGDGVKAISFRVKKGTSTSAIVRINDTTAAAERGRIEITWSGSVPSIAMGTGTHLSTTDLGNGVYRIVYATTSITAANTHTFGAFPAYNLAGSAALTGDTYFGDIQIYNITTAGLVYDAGFSSGYPSGYTAETLEGMNIGWRHVTPSDQAARYWRFNIADTANPDGYVQAGRLFVMGAWQPTVNMSDGARLPLSTETRRTVSDGAAAIYDPKPVRRELAFVLNDLPEAEILDNGLQLQRLAATHRQVFVVYDPDDTTLAHHRAFPAVIKELSAIDFPYASRASLPLSFVEEL